MPEVKQLPTTDWPMHIKAWQASKLSGVDYCAQHKLNYDQFGYYKRKLAGSNHRQSAAKNMNQKGFTAINVSSYEPTPENSLSLILPSGIRIEGVDQSNLSVCRALIECLP